jgi:ubiquinone/menaquinone biosynthesis C-methylase UbiE
VTSKHVPLSDEELNAFRVRTEVPQTIARVAETLNIERENLRILDWGSGRGRTVIKLLEMGIDAYGVDIAAGPLKNGADAFRRRGEDPEHRLRLINADASTPFPDGFFHLVLSDQVFEHVQDLDAVVAELKRVTMPGGMGLHFFPAKWRVVEPHLFVPFVHWLPKNRIRRLYLRAMLKRIPVWEGLEGKTPSQRAQVYYEYSVQKTYYRPLRCIRSTLQRAGFRTRFQASDHRFRRLVRWTGPIGRWALGTWSNHFHEVTLSTQLPRLP